MGHILSYWHFARHTPRSVKNSKGPKMVRAGGSKGGGPGGEAQGQANRAHTSSFRPLHTLTDPYRPLQTLTYPCIPLHTLIDPYRSLQILTDLAYPCIPLHNLTDFGVGAWARAMGGWPGGGGRAPFWGLSNILGGCGEQSANMIRYGPWATVVHLQAQLC